MQGKLIVIEAGDGCGKQTQTGKLFEALARKEYPVRKVEFPDYDSDSSALIKMYLKGEFGREPGDVNPYAASAFYAVDRYASYKKHWHDFYHSGGIVIADRYTTSNMIHQAVKIADEAEKRNFLDWLLDFEFSKCCIPVPDCVIFLDVPPEYSSRLIQNRENKYGAAEKDIHERNQQYLADCYVHSRLIARWYGWKVISCVAAGRMKSIEEIHQAILGAVLNVIGG